MTDQLPSQLQLGQVALTRHIHVHTLKVYHVVIIASHAPVYFFVGHGVLDCSLGIWRSLSVSTGDIGRIDGADFDLTDCFFWLYTQSILLCRAVLKSFYGSSMKGYEGNEGNQSSYSC